MASLVDFAYYGCLLLASPWIVAKVAPKRGRRHLAGLAERLGRCKRRRSRRPCVWIHGVSVGEIRSAASLVSELERELPGYEVVLSTTTGTGQEVARRLYGGRRVFYFPIDFSWSVRRVFEAIRPSLVILVELEIWPNFLQEAQRRRVPVVLVNGRITEKSYRGYRLVRGWLFDPIGKIGTFCVQTERYAERFRRLGIPAQSIHVTGSVKYDELEPEEVAPGAVREELGLDAGETVLMGGSTHPGEERLLHAAYRQLRAEHPRLRLVLVPRHTERADEVAGALERAGERVVRRTDQRALDGDGRLPQGTVLLVDTVGELGRLYAAADLVFVGGSLIPHGGQNMLEPVMHGKPTLFGPHVQNFREPVERLLAARGARQVSDGSELARALGELLASPDEAAALGRRGRGALLAARGATARTVRIIKDFLAARGERLPEPSSADGALAAGPADPQVGA